MSLLAQISCGIALAMLLVGCKSEPVPDYSAAEFAYSAHAYHEARSILLDRIDDGDNTARTKLLMANTMLELGDGYASERYIDQLNDDELEPVKRAQLKAHGLIIRGKARLALKFLDQEVEDKDRTAGIYHMLIWAHSELGTLVKNDELVVDALEKFPNDPSLHALTGKFYQSVENWEYAAEGVRRALALDPEHYEAKLLSGELAIQRGDLMDALVIYQSITDRYSVHAVPKVNVAGLQLDLGLLAEAEQTITNAVRQHPDFDLLKFQKARLEHAQGRYAEASRTLDSMRMRVEDYGPALMLSSLVALELGNREIATVQLLRVSRDGRFEAEAKKIISDHGLH